MMFGWLIIGLIIYYFFKEKGTTFTNSDKSESKLKERYVNGEIDDETYLRMNETIKK